MNGIVSPDYAQFEAIRQRAMCAGVSTRLTYWESNDTWCFEFVSAGPTECYIGKDYSWPVAIDAANKWLDRIKAPQADITTITVDSE